MYAAKRSKRASHTGRYCSAHPGHGYHLGVDHPPDHGQLPAPPSQPKSRQQPTATATKSRTDRGSPTVEGGGTATFQHFEVVVRKIRRGADIQVLADVCVLSLPPDPQGNRTRISWDPWSITTNSKSVHAARSKVPLMGGFPAERTYRARECASGWIPFPTTKRPVRINYRNGVGDVAVWDAEHPDQSPRTSQAPTEADVTYDNCSDVRAAGKAPIRRGDPGYGAHLDDDDDGIACEQ